MPSYEPDQSRRKDLRWRRPGDSGVVVYVMVADIVLRPDQHGAVVFGHFRVPAGNLLGTYSEQHEPNG